MKDWGAAMRVMLGRGGDESSQALADEARAAALEATWPKRHAMVNARAMVTRSAMGSNSVVSARCERPPAFARAGK